MKKTQGNGQFGELISVYTEEQAVKEGVLMHNPSATFEECNMLTANLWEYLRERCFRMTLTSREDLLEILMGLAKDIYENERFEGDNDKNFFVIKGNENVKPVWFARNEQEKLTAMMPEDF